MALEIVWADEANEDLDEVIKYLKEKWTEEQIHNFFSSIRRMPDEY